MTISYKGYIDWTGNGVFTDAGEDVSSRIRATPGITLERGKDTIKALSPPMAGICGYELDNQSRDYSIENAGGPLYGNLKLGRRAYVVPTLSQTQTITPSLGAELVTNGGFDVDLNWTKEAGWTISGGNAVATAVAGALSIYQALGFVLGEWYTATWTILDYASGTFKLYLGGNDPPPSRNANGTYTECRRYVGGGATLYIEGTGPGTAKVDNVSVKQLTLSSMLGTLIVGPTFGEWTSHPTLTTNNPCGMVLNWDGLSDGTQDFVLAYHDGTNAHLEKCVAGVYTSLINAAVAYSAGAELKVIRAIGTNTYQLWYNSVQIGADQTISDASVISNKGYAGFSTLSTNTCGAITATGGEYTLFTGYINDMFIHPERQKKSVSFSFLDAFSKLRGLTISTPLYQSIRTDQALGYILDAVGLLIASMTTGLGAAWNDGGTWDSVLLGGAALFGTTERVFDAGQTTLDWWWASNEDAYEAMIKVLTSEGPGAALYIDGAGRLHFESRHYRFLTARCTTSQASFAEESTSEPAFSDFQYDARLQDVINDVQATVKEREAGALSAVWTSTEYITLAANEVRNIVVTGGNPFINAITPVPGVDFTLISGAVSIGLLRDSGATTEIILTAGSSGASIVNLQLRAQAVTVTRTKTVRSTVSASDSLDDYNQRGRNPETLALLAEMNENLARDIVNAYVLYYQEPRTVIQIAVKNANDTRLMHQIGREISDRITVAETQTGLNGDLWIERIKHTIDRGGKYHETIFGCEKVFAFSGGDPAAWDDGGTWDSVKVSY